MPSAGRVAVPTSAVGRWWAGLAPEPEAESKQGPPASQVVSLRVLSGMQLTETGAARLLAQHGSVEAAINRFFDLVSREPDKVIALNDSAADGQPAEQPSTAQTCAVRVEAAAAKHPGVTTWMDMQLASLGFEASSFGRPAEGEPAAVARDAVAGFGRPAEGEPAAVASTTAVAPLSPGCAAAAAPSPEVRPTKRRRLHSQRTAKSRSATRSADPAAKRRRVRSPSAPPAEPIAEVCAAVAPQLFEGIAQAAPGPAPERSALEGVPARGILSGGWELGCSQSVLEAGPARHARTVYTWTGSGSSWLIPCALLSCANLPPPAPEQQWAEIAVAGASPTCHAAMQVAASKIRCVHVPAGQGPPRMAMHAVRAAVRKLLPDTLVVWRASFGEPQGGKAVGEVHATHATEDAALAALSEAPAGCVARVADGQYVLCSMTEPEEGKEGCVHWDVAGCQGFTVTVCGLGCEQVVGWLKEAVAGGTPVHLSSPSAFDAAACAAIQARTGCGLSSAERLARAGEVHVWEWWDGEGKESWAALTPQQSAVVEEASARADGRVLVPLLPLAGLIWFEFVSPPTVALQVSPQGRGRLRRGAEQTQVLSVGEKVRVRAHVTKPTYAWGSVRPGSVGVVTSVTSTKCRVRFPQSSSWRGHLPEMIRDEELSCDGSGYVGIVGPKTARVAAQAMASEELQVRREQLRFLPAAELTIARQATLIASRCGLRSLTVCGPGQCIAFGLRPAIARARQALAEITSRCSAHAGEKRLAEARETILWELARIEVRVPITGTAREQLAAPRHVTCHSGSRAARRRGAATTASAAPASALQQPEAACRSFTAAFEQLSAAAAELKQLLESAGIDTSDCPGFASPALFTLPYFVAEEGALELLRPLPGSRVKVRPTVRTPALNWGQATSSCVGVVSASSTATGLTTVDFPKNRDWNGLHCELEVIEADGEKKAETTEGYAPCPGTVASVGVALEEGKRTEAAAVLSKVLGEWVTSCFTSSRPTPGRPSVLHVVVKVQGAQERSATLWCPTDSSMKAEAVYQPCNELLGDAVQLMRLHWAFAVDCIMCELAEHSVAAPESQLSERELRRVYVRAESRLKNASCQLESKAASLRERLAPCPSPRAVVDSAEVATLRRWMLAALDSCETRATSAASAATAAVRTEAAALLQRITARQRAMRSSRSACDELKAVSEASGAFCTYRPPDHYISVAGDEASVRSALSMLSAFTDPGEDWNAETVRHVRIDELQAKRLRRGSLVSGTMLNLVKRQTQLSDLQMSPSEHDEVVLRGSARSVHLAEQLLTGRVQLQSEGGSEPTLKRSLTAEWGRPGGVTTAALCADGSMTCDACLLESDEAPYSLLCGHKVHPSCMRGWRDGRAETIQGGAGETGKQGGEAVSCPAHKCSHVLTPREYVDTIGADGALNNLFAQLSGSVQTHDRLRHCRKCEVLLCAGKETAPLTCVCGERMCSRRRSACGDVAHYFCSCEQFLRAKAAQLRRRGCDADAATAEAATRLPDDVVACSQCQSLILRDEDMGERCKYMHCRQCDYEFCWRCLQPAQDHRHIDPENPSGPTPSCDPERRKERQEALAARGGAAVQTCVWTGHAGCARCGRYPLGADDFACLQCLSSYLCKDCEPQGCPDGESHVLAALPLEKPRTAPYDPLTHTPRCRKGHVMAMNPGAMSGCDCAECQQGWRCDDGGPNAMGCGRRATTHRWYCHKCNSSCCLTCHPTTGQKGQQLSSQDTVDDGLWAALASADEPLWQGVQGSGHSDAGPARPAPRESRPLHCGVLEAIFGEPPGEPLRPPSNAPRADQPGSAAPPLTRRLPPPPGVRRGGNLAGRMLLERLVDRSGDSAELILALMRQREAELGTPESRPSDASEARMSDGTSYTDAQVPGTMSPSGSGDEQSGSGDGSVDIAEEAEE
eukprot:TRINITY_DN4055_c0_g1_i1.p1 TRINITY_DN4055_c0_g1~~TRINITY_DN4055_c0_g1_i1.p1  ORF type:complete len:1925 (+),score=609.15 TRINITY_DN4055_c0_g1_i1:27-5777(+)